MDKRVHDLSNAFLLFQGKRYPTPRATCSEARSAGTMKNIEHRFVCLNPPKALNSKTATYVPIATARTFRRGGKIKERTVSTVILNIKLASMIWGIRCTLRLLQVRAIAMFLRKKEVNVVSR
jgi:hypothetical protein